MFKVLDDIKDLPENKPHYLMGANLRLIFWEQLKKDRHVRLCYANTIRQNRLSLTWNGRINIKNNKYQNDNCLDEKFENLNLNKYSKNYLNHLFNTNEILGSMILTLNNINFYQELMCEIRKNIQKGTFNHFTINMNKL